MIYDIVHRTEYLFNQLVGFDLHRLLFRPRDGHDMRVLATDLQVEPAAERVDLLHDVYGNSIAHVKPGGPADHLLITTRFTVDHLGSGAFVLPTVAESSLIPPAYGHAELLALQPFLLPSYPDPGHLLRADALRCLGIAARFVSGYLYVPPVQGNGHAGGGATHAWVQCYLPDCGWFPADPTNNLIGGHDLIRVAVGREASEVVPLTGSWFGGAGDFARHRGRQRHRAGVTVVVPVRHHEAAGTEPVGLGSWLH